jgi:hypothetical protein
MKAEGWYADPYRRHRARWFSNGTPTALVSNGTSESSDPPPDVPYAGPLEPIDHGEDFAHRDRDDPARGDDEGIESAWDAFVESGGD